MTNVLVTGASGFVGAAVVRELLARGHHVRAVLRRPEQAIGSVSVAIIGDLAAPIDWSPHLDGIEAIVHAAGLAHGGGRGQSRRLFAVNAEATDRLMHAARRAGVRQAIHISSVRAITGARCDEIVGEDHPPQPTDDYGRSKLEAEQAVVVSGIAGTILRPPLVHGAHVRGNLALLTRAAALPLPLPLGGLTARRSIVSDRNLASAVAHLLERPPSAMSTALIADAEPLTVPDIIAKLRAGLARRPGLIAAPSAMAWLFAALNRRALWDSLAGRLELAPTRLAATGWQAIETSDAGLARTMAAVRS